MVVGHVDDVKTDAHDRFGGWTSNSLEMSRRSRKDIFASGDLKEEGGDNAITSTKWLRLTKV